MRNSIFGFGIFIVIIGIMYLLTYQPMPSSENIAWLDIYTYWIMIAVGGALIFIGSVLKKKEAKTKNKKTL